MIVRPAVIVVLRVILPTGPTFAGGLLAGFGAFIRVLLPLRLLFRGGRLAALLLLRVRLLGLLLLLLLDLLILILLLLPALLHRLLLLLPIGRSRLLVSGRSLLRLRALRRPLRGGRARAGREAATRGGATPRITATATPASGRTTATSAPASAPAASASACFIHGSHQEEECGRNGGYQRSSGVHFFAPVCSGFVVPSKATCVTCAAKAIFRAPWGGVKANWASRISGARFQSENCARN